MRIAMTRIASIRWTVAGLGLVCLAVMAWRLIDGTGHDYSYFFPRMLDSYLFLKANGLALHEYTASYCAGIFVFANPQSIAQSLPQVLLFAVDPVTSVRLTFVVFSALGGAGMYLSARRLELAPDAALVAAAAFSFSGFLVVRMMVGHVTMHTIALAPLVAWTVMQGLHDLAAGRRLAGGAFLAGGALLLATAVYSGGAALLLQFGAVVGFMTLIYAIRQGTVLRAFAALLAVAGFALIVAAPKVEAGISVLEGFPKDYHTLPGFTVAGLVRYLGEALFFSPSVPALNEVLIGRTFRTGWHEFYVGLTPFVLLMLVAPLAWAKARRRLLLDLAGNRAIVGVGLAYLLLPLVLNIHVEGWNAFLQSVPLLGKVNTLLRWSVILVPLFALLAGRAATYWDLAPAARPAMAAALAVAMTAYQLIVPSDTLKKEQDYDPGETLQAWTLIHERDATPPQVTQIGMRLRRDDAGKLQAQWSPWMDNAFLSGASNALCYEPLFGYRLGRYPFGRLRPGGIGPPQPDGTLNLKNPACYVCPKANGCAPGDHFREEQTQLVADLLARKPVVLATSQRRHLADAAGIVGLVVCFGLVGAALTTAALARVRRRRNT